MDPQRVAVLSFSASGYLAADSIENARRMPDEMLSPQKEFLPAFE